jgi:hypothetical protein
MYPYDEGQGARRCSMHGINYPNRSTYDRCLVCNCRTFWVPVGTVDEDWAGKVAMFHASTPDATDDPEGVLQLSNVTVTSLEDGLYAIDSREVVRSDVRHRLNPYDVVRIGKQLFEILGYSYSRREYVITPLGWTDEGLDDLLG